MVSATSLRAAVVAWMSSLPRMSRTPIRNSSLSWKLCRIRSGSSALRHRSASSSRKSAREQVGAVAFAQQFGELEPQIGLAARLIQYQAVQQFIDHARVGDQDLR